MILSDKKFDTIQGKIPGDLYKKLVNRKKRASEEDISIREELVRKLCVVRDEVHFNQIMKDLSTHLRTKKRTIQIMGGRYEEINAEIEKAIIKVMSENAGESSVVEKSKDQVEEAEQEDIPSPPAINIDDEIMIVEGTKITLDSDDKLFKNLENIVDNLAFEEQETTKGEEKIETKIVEPKVIEKQEPVPTLEEISLTPETSKKTQIGSMIENLGKEVDDDDQM